MDFLCVYSLGILSSVFPWDANKICRDFVHVSFSDWSFTSVHPSISALQPWVSLGLRNNQSPLLSVFCLLHPLLYLHYFQVCYDIIHPSQAGSSSSSAYEQSSIHHLPWHCSHFHSLYMSHPSLPLSFYKFYNTLSIYGSVQFFIYQCISV